MKKSLFIFYLFILTAITCIAQDRYKLVVQAGEYDRQNCVVSVDLSKINVKEPAFVQLYELAGKKRIPVYSQLLNDGEGKQQLYWIVDGKIEAGQTRTFVLFEGNKKLTTSLPMKVDDTGKALVLKKNDKEVIQYNYEFTNPPEGVDKKYGRSGYIHPAYSPAGNTLTTIQPKDHYHHYGIWNPWTRIEYDGSLYDLWNLGDLQGTVKAEKIGNTYEGTVFSGYDAMLGHYIFTPSGEKKIMDEWWKVKTWNTGEGFLWDFESNLQPSTALPVLLKEYRYAGFGYRATEDWTRENCEMMTSEGKSRQQIDGSTARWIYIVGDTPSGRSGLLFLGHPDNYNAPQPLRIWDENANGKRGDAFINFAPTKNMDWELKPEQKYILRYQVLSFENGISSEEANRLWNDFAYPPIVEIKSIN